MRVVVENMTAKPKKRPTKSYSLDNATAELIKKYMETNQQELLKKNIFTTSDLLRAAVLDYLNDYFDQNPGTLEEYIALRQKKR